MDYATLMITFSEAKALRKVKGVLLTKSIYFLNPIIKYIFWYFQLNTHFSQNRMITLLPVIEIFRHVAHDLLAHILIYLIRYPSWSLHFDFSKEIKFFLCMENSCLCMVETDPFCLFSKISATNVYSTVYLFLFNQFLSLNT